MLSTWLKIGARNLLKNRRRSLFTVGAIALGFAAVNLFGGFTAYLFKGLEEGYVYAFANGHLTAFKKGFLTEGRLRPLDYLLDEAEIEAIRGICRRDPRVVLTSPQLFLSGLISNGDASMIFVSMANEPSSVRETRSRATSFVKDLDMYDGKPLSEDTPYGVGLSRGLARNLKMSFDANPVVVAPTVDGQMNALDAYVLNVFDSAYDMLDDKVMHVTLEFAQNLYDTRSADRVMILLEHAGQVAAVKGELERQFAQENVDAALLTWEELCPSYARIRDMFHVIFLFLFGIVFVIVVLSIINTVSMAVLERTREIGTLRALGLKRRGALTMFAAESALLGLFGSAIGMLITASTWGALKITQPKWTPPVFAVEVPFQVYLVPEYIVGSLVFLVVLAMGAAVLPARRASRMSIIDALGHV